MSSSDEEFLSAATIAEFAATVAADVDPAVVAFDEASGMLFDPIDEEDVQ